MHCAHGLTDLHLHVPASSLQHDVDVMMIGDDDFKSLAPMTNIYQTSIAASALTIALSIHTLREFRIDWFMYATGGSNCQPEGIDAFMHEKGGVFPRRLGRLVSYMIITLRY